MHAVHRLTVAVLPPPSTASGLQKVELEELRRQLDAQQAQRLADKAAEKGAFVRVPAAAGSLPHSHVCWRCCETPCAARQHTGTHARTHACMHARTSVLTHAH